MFRFAHPDFLYLLFLLPALVAFYVYAMIVKKKAIKKYGNPTLLAELMPEVSTKRQHLKFWLLFLLCAPCFAAMGAIKREMNNAKWFWFAIGYQCLLAYLVSLCIFQFGTLFTGGGFGIGTVAAIVILIGFLYMLFRPYKESTSLKANTVSSVKAASK